jgi:hypothetical protein
VLVAVDIETSSLMRVVAVRLGEGALSVEWTEMASTDMLLRRAARSVKWLGGTAISTSWL